MIQIKETIKGLLALILLAGFLELLLPEDEMRKYIRLVIGLIVLFSLIKLLPNVREDLSPEIIPTGLPGGYPDSSVLVTEGVKLRQVGEDKAEQVLNSAKEEKLEQVLKKITGIEGIKVEICNISDEKVRIKIILNSDPGVSLGFLQRLAGELLKIDERCVEVEEKFE